MKIITIIATCFALSPALKAEEPEPPLSKAAQDLINAPVDADAVERAEKRNQLMNANSIHYKLAKQCGRANAAMIEQMPELYPDSEKAAHEMAKMQASMFGLDTVEEIELFIEIAEEAALDQLEILKEIE